MKRTAAVVFTLLLSASAFGGETQRYLVATKRPFHAGALRAVMQDVDASPRDVTPFVAFDGFAATLTKSEAAEMRKSAAVRWVEPVVERHALEVPSGQLVPYGISAIHAPEARTARQTEVVNVVVIDSGIDFRHPELQDIWAGGVNFVTVDAEPLDDNGHGTHVAGTIAAADNGVGVVGVAPHVRLWAAKVLAANGVGSNESVIEAIDWMVACQAELGGKWIANLSLGSAAESQAEREACQRAADRGIIIVAAAGNGLDEALPAPVMFPAAYPTVVAVGATDIDHKIAKFSNQGPELDVSAPGVGVLSTLPVGSNFDSYLLERGAKRNAQGLVGSGVGLITGDFVYCGLGNPGEFPANVAGKIALIRRGEIPFATKTRNAVAAGAAGVAIFNHDDSTNNWTLLSEPGDENVAWPITVRLSRVDGEAILSHGSSTITISNERYDYGEKSGTSMASPHVAGAVALLWSIAPAATPQSIVNALISTSIDRGAPGQDNAFGAGEIDVYAAAKMLAPGAFTPRRRAAGH